jgi:hypothetical protein
MGRKTENIFFKIRNDTRCPMSPLLVNIVLALLARAIRKGEEIKGIQIEIIHHFQVICSYT